MKKLTITNLEVMNIIAWYNQLTQEKQNAIPMKVRFNLKKFITKIMSDAKEFESFRDNEYKIIQSKYSSDEYSYDAEEAQKDENGNEMKDENGNIILQTIRKVKDEHMNEYNDDIEKLNNKLVEILNETNTYEYNSMDIDAMVDSLPDDTPLEFDDINMLDAIFTDNGEA